MTERTITTLTLQTDAGPVELEVPTDRDADDRPLYDQIDQFALEELRVNLITVAEQGNVQQLREVIRSKEGVNVSDVPQTAARRVTDLLNN